MSLISQWVVLHPWAPASAAPCILEVEVVSSYWRAWVWGKTFKVTNAWPGSHFSLWTKGFLFQYNRVQMSGLLYLMVVQNVSRQILVTPPFCLTATIHALWKLVFAFPFVSASGWKRAHKLWWKEWQRRFISWFLFLLPSVCIKEWITGHFPALKREVPIPKCNWMPAT